MGCSCEIDTYVDDCERVALYKYKKVTARKSHVCGECRKSILIGTEYEIISYKFEGEFFNERTCPDCLSAREQFYPKGGGFMFGFIWEEIKNHIEESYGDIPEDCLVELTPEAREKVCYMIEAAYEE